MEEMWTPWRMRYILANKDEGGCVFCHRSKETKHHGFILSRGPLTFTILNLYPYAVGHLMVIPYRHLPRLNTLTPLEREELALRLAEAERILRRAAGASWFHAGVNLGRAAGAGVDGHLHAHLVPRGLRADWTQGPVGADGLPVAIEETYRRLLPWFAEPAAR
jgi:ATP adenylyltransferase